MLNFPSLDFPICLWGLGLLKARPNDNSWSTENSKHLCTFYMTFVIRYPVPFSRVFLQFFFCCTPKEAFLATLHICFWSFPYLTLSLHAQHAQLQSFQVNCFCIHLLHASFLCLVFMLWVSWQFCWLSGRATQSLEALSKNKKYKGLLKSFKVWQTLNFHLD